ncbi:MAG: hypothetical protein IPI84_14335 [Holophagaceae bacterium]|nr:hypothetical protein [Holophagaceae bacterium]
MAAERLEETQPTSTASSSSSERHGVRHLTLHFETQAMAERHQHRFLHRHEGEEHGHHGELRTTK